MPRKSIEGRRLYDRKYYINHLEAEKKYNREYYLAHKKESFIRAKKHRTEHHEQFLATQRRLAKKYHILYPLRHTFHNIKYRCNTPSCKNYKSYGGRGIKCLLSLEDLNFLWKRDRADLMKRPHLHRINSDGNYELSNCVFLTINEHAKKRFEKKP